jgi:hypothetical protein
MAQPASSRVGKHLTLPRYAGAGETSIHRALRVAEKYLEEDKPLDALLLLMELRSDLRQARATMAIESLMDKWNAHSPSSLQVDVLLPDLDQFLKNTERLYRLAKKAHRIWADHHPEFALASDKGWLSRFSRGMGWTSAKQVDSIVFWVRPRCRPRPPPAR